MGEEKELPPGRKLIECFTPFLMRLATSGLSKRTIQNHVDNMWLLGGEIIRDLNEDPPLRKVAADQLIRNVIHEDGGPLIHNGSENEQRSFEPCRQCSMAVCEPKTLLNNLGRFCFECHRTDCAVPAIRHSV